MFLATVGLLIVYLHPSVGGGLPDHSHTLFGCGLYNISARLSVCLDFEGLRGKKKTSKSRKTACGARTRDTLSLSCLPSVISTSLKPLVCVASQWQTIKTHISSRYSCNLRAPPHDLQRGVHEERSNTEGNKQWPPVSHTHLDIACVAVGTEVILGSIFSARPQRYCTDHM